MPLNPAIEMLLNAMASMAPPTDWTSATVEEVRAMYDGQMIVAEALAMARVADVSIPVEGAEIAARLYVPEGAGENPPLTVYFHGGGWVIGSLETHDGTCRALAQASGVAVLSIDYRLAPEHPYPQAALDCYAATVWAAENGAALGVDAARLAVAGDSAGGNLAAVVALMARDRGGPALRHQLLLYPVTDTDFSFPSYAENGGGEYYLGTETMRWFWRHYLDGQSPDDAPLATVLRAPDVSGVAPAYILTAEYDPLRDEGAAYAKRLEVAGVDCTYDCAPGMIHGFMSMSAMVPDVAPWMAKSGQALARALQ